MDPLSIAAGAVSFVSLTLQLLDWAEKLHYFWSSAEGATADIQTIISDLHLLRIVLSRIAQDEENLQNPPFHLHKPRPCDLVMQRCLLSVTKLADLTTQFHPDFARTKMRRKMQGFKIAFKKPQIDKFQQELERTKTLLMLEQLRLNGLRGSVQYSSIVQELANLALLQAAAISARNDVKSQHEADNLFLNSESRIHPSKTDHLTSNDSSLTGIPSREFKLSSLWRMSFRRRASKIFKTFFGTVVLVSQVHSFHQTGDNMGTKRSHIQDFNEWTAKIVPVGIFRLICKSVIDVSLSWSISRAPLCRSMSLEPRLRYYPAVPETAMIFEACRLGNIQWATSLFNHNVASPFDTDPRGWTPLHVAAYHNQYELCKVLLELGAETNSQTLLGAHPLGLACLGDRFQHTELLNLVRLLVEEGKSDPTIQDNIGDDCLYHIRRSPSISRYLRLENSIKIRDNPTDPYLMANWAVINCDCPRKIKKALDQGVNLDEWRVGYRAETGPLLHAVASSLNPIQTTPEGLDREARDARIKETMVLILSSGRSGYNVSAVDDNLATAFDIALELCRKWRYRKVLTIWRAGIEGAGLDWDEYISNEKALHSIRKRSEYLGARDYYWSLQVQMDYWLSDEWEEEEKERLFWNPEKFDFDPVEGGSDAYIPSITELETWRSRKLPDYNGGRLRRGDIFGMDFIPLLFGLGLLAFYFVVG